MKRFLTLILALAMTLSLAVCLTGCGGKKSLLDPKDPVTLTMWHVYGEQAESPMNRLVDEFNRTVGLEQGIVVDVTLMSNGAQIGEKLLESQAGKPGAPDMPDLFFCHANNAAALGPDKLLDWRSCFSQEELNGYVPEFTEEGVLDDRLVIFPVSKSTHLLFLNGTQFDRFSAETGVTAADLSTWEGFLSAAEQYFHWSGGKAFCAIDYLVRAVELNLLSQGRSVEMRDGWYDFSSADLKDSWMMFARSLAQGHIVVSDLYANTQVMTGETMSGLSSSAAVLYYNDVVTYPDNTTEDMDLRILPQPQADVKNSMITQAGVGLCALATDDRKAEAASVFAHWLTEPRRNLDFVVDAGYMPVNKSSFDVIDDYDFTQESREKLFSTLKDVRSSCTSVVEPAFEGYYGKIHQLYDQLRKLQPQLKERALAGESVDALAEETWKVFESIQ